MIDFGRTKDGKWFACCLVIISGNPLLLWHRELITPDVSKQNNQFHEFTIKVTAIFIHQAQAAGLENREALRYMRKLHDTGILRT